MGAASALRGNPYGSIPPGRSPKKTCACVFGTYPSKPPEDQCGHPVMFPQGPCVATPIYRLFYESRSGRRTYGKEVLCEHCLVTYIEHGMA
jgi:hypothetical protein